VLYTCFLLLPDMDSHHHRKLQRLLERLPELCSTMVQASLWGKLLSSQVSKITSIYQNQPSHLLQLSQPASSTFLSSSSTCLPNLERETKKIGPVFHNWGLWIFLQNQEGMKKKAFDSAKFQKPRLSGGCMHACIMML
jgi:hypothetical protein